MQSRGSNSPWSQGPRHIGHVRILVVDILWTHHECHVTCHIDDPDAAFLAGAELGSLTEHGQQGEGKGMVCEEIGLPLDLMTIFRQLVWAGHDLKGGTWLD